LPHTEFFGALGQHDHVIYQLLAVDVGHPERHLGLMVDENDS
jgi:hypothetical protein